MSVIPNPCYLIPPSTSATASLNGSWFDLKDLINCAITVTFTGSNVIGTLTLEGTNDQSDPGVTISSSSQAISNSSPHMWNITGAGFRYIRPVWAYTSGTGNISSRIYVKQF